MEPISSSRRPKSKLAGLVLLLLIGYAAYTYQQLELIQRSINNIEQSMGGVIDETGRKLKIVDQITAFGQDLNEIRRFLYLPAKDYDFSLADDTFQGDEQDPANLTGTGSQLASLLFQYADKLAEEKKKQDNLVSLKKTFEAAFREEDVKTKALNKGLVFSPLTESQTGFQIQGMLGKTLLVSWSLQRDTGRIVWADFQGQKDFNMADFQTDLIPYLENLEKTIVLKNQVEAAQKTINEMMAAQNMISVLENRQLSYLNSEIKNKDGTVLIRIFPDVNNAAFQIAAGKSAPQSFAEVKTLQTALLELINNLDTTTVAERLLKQKQAEVLAILNDPAFQDVLRERGLTAPTAPVIETDRIYFHITDSQQVRLSSIVIEKGTGEVKVVDGQGLNATSLEEFLALPGSKKKP